MNFVKALKIKHQKGLAQLIVIFLGGYKSLSIPPIRHNVFWLRVKTLRPKTKIA
jgi:hypothetical protein